MSGASDGVMVLLALGIITLGGWGAATLLGDRKEVRSCAESASLAWLLGAGVTSLMLWIGGMFVSGVSLQIFVTVGCCMLAWLGWRRVRHGPSRTAWSLSYPWVEWAIVIAITAQIVIVSLIAARHPLGWDGLLNWEIKARYAFLNGGVLPTAYFHSESRAFSHPEYPLFIPLTEAWVYLWLGSPNQYWAMIVFPLFYAAGATLLVTGGARLSGTRWAGGIAASVMFLVPYLLIGPGNVVSGYADFPLGVIYMASVIYLLKFSLENRQSSFRIAAALMALLPWMKREGIILYGICVVIGAWILWRRRASWRCWVGLATGLVLSVAWSLFIHANAILSGRDFVPVSLSGFIAHVNRVELMIGMGSREVLRFDRWNIFWPTLVLALAWRLLRRANRDTVLLTGAVFAPIAFYSLTYVFSGWQEVERHISGSLPRLLMQVVPLGSLAIGLATSHGTSSRDPQAERHVN